MGNVVDYRAFEAYKKISIWFYRHQIWLSMREQKGIGKGELIGKSIVLDSRHHVVALDSTGECWCGSRKAYIDCHMTKDLCMHDSLDFEKATEYTKRNRAKTILQFNNEYIMTRKYALELLKTKLLE